MNIEVPAFAQVLTGDGDSGGVGYATVADNSGFYVGCVAYINNNATQKRCVIVDLVGTTKVGLRFISEEFGTQAYPVYGGHSSLAAFTVATASRLNMDRQLAKIQPPWTRTGLPG